VHDTTGGSPGSEGAKKVGSFKKWPKKRTGFDKNRLKKINGQKKKNSLPSGHRVKSPAYVIIDRGGGY